MRGNRGGARGGGRGRGGHTQNASSRQRRPILNEPVQLSTGRFLASVNAQARVPAAVSGVVTTTTNQVERLHGSGGGPGPSLKPSTLPHSREPVPSSVPVPATSTSGNKNPEPAKSGETNKATSLTNSRWNPDNSSSVVPVVAAPLDTAPGENWETPTVDTTMPQQPVVQITSNVRQGSDLVPLEPSSLAKQDNPVKLITENRGIRIRLLGRDSISYTAAYRVLQKGTLRKLAIKKDVDNVVCIDDVITPDTTLFANIDVPTTVTYCAHIQDAELTVWEIMFPMPHEAASFQRNLMPGGARDNLRPAVAIQVAPVTTVQVAAPSADLLMIDDALPEVAADDNNDLLGLDDEDEKPQRSAMLDMGLLAVDLVEPIFVIINDHELGSFMDRLFARTFEINERSTAAEILTSGEAFYAAESIAREFFSNSALFTTFTHAEETAYIEMLTPGLLAFATDQRDAANAAVQVSETAGVPLVQTPVADIVAQPSIVPIKAEDAEYAPMTKYSAEEILDLRDDQAGVQPSFKNTPSMNVKSQSGRGIKSEDSTICTLQLIVPALLTVSDADVTNAIASRPIEQPNKENIVPVTAIPEIKIEKSTPTKHHVATNSDVDRLALSFGQFVVNDRTELNEALLQPGLSVQAKGATSKISSLSLSKQASEVNLPKMTEAAESVKSESTMLSQGSSSSSSDAPEARKMIGLANLAKSRFADDHYLSKLMARAPTSTMPPTPTLTPTIPTPVVVVKDGLSASELVAIEERKQRGESELAKSRWAVEHTDTPKFPVNTNTNRFAHRGAPTMQPRPPMRGTRQLAAVIAPGPGPGNWVRVVGFPVPNFDARANGYSEDVFDYAAGTGSPTVGKYQACSSI